MIKLNFYTFLDISGGRMRFIKKIILSMLLLVLCTFINVDIEASASEKDYSVSNLEWDDSGEKILARWDRGEDKSPYKIQLYKGSKKIGSIITLHGNSYDFTRALKDAGSGSYYFTIYPSKVSADQRESETKTSPGYSLDYDLLRYFRSKLPPKNAASENKVQSPLHPWKHVGKRWQFIQSDDTLARSKWIYHNNKWYYFDLSTYMVIGWQYINNKWYYFKNDGDMATGWYFVNNRWYLLGNDGDMLTGWQNYNDKWYYLDTVHGYMYSNTTTPDNYKVNADGVYIAN